MRDRRKKEGNIIHKFRGTILGKRWINEFNEEGSERFNG